MTNFGAIDFFPFPILTHSWSYSWYKNFRGKKDLPLSRWASREGSYGRAGGWVETLALWWLVLVTPSCLTLYNPMDFSPAGSSVYGILQARIWEWVVISFSRGSSQPRDWTRVTHIAGRFFTVRAPGKHVDRENPTPICSNKQGWSFVFSACMGGSCDFRDPLQWRAQDGQKKQSMKTLS